MKSFPFTLGGDYGCSFILGMYPNGIQSGKNTHLSLYFGVLKGEYDAVLAWPLEKEFTITLIDQQEGENVVLSGRVLFARPLTDEQIATWGFDQYISHNVLKKRRCVVDDTVNSIHNGITTVAAILKQHS